MIPKILFHVMFAFVLSLNSVSLARCGNKATRSQQGTVKHWSSLNTTENCATTFQPPDNRSDTLLRIITLASIRLNTSDYVEILTLPDGKTTTHLPVNWSSPWNTWCGIYGKAETLKDAAKCVEDLASCNAFALYNSQWPPKVEAQLVHFDLDMRYEFFRCKQSSPATTKQKNDSWQQHIDDVDSYAAVKISIILAATFVFLAVIGYKYWKAKSLLQALQKWSVSDGDTTKRQAESYVNSAFDSPDSLPPPFTDQSLSPDHNQSMQEKTDQNKNYNEKSQRQTTTL